MTTLPAGFELRETARTVAILRSAEAYRLERAGVLAGSRLVDPEPLFRHDDGATDAREDGAGRGRVIPLGSRSPARSRRTGASETAASALGEARGAARVEAAQSGDAEAGAHPGDGGLLLKRYRRGGLAGRFLPDVFLSEGRMLADLESSERLRARGVPTSRILALAFVRQSIGLLTRAYVVTEEVAGASTLAAGLRRASTLAAGQRGGSSLSAGLAGEEGSSLPASGPFAVAERAVRTVRRMHDAGVLHRDLNLGNLLVTGAEIVVIDLDGARIVESASAGKRFANLSRLDRSYVKTFGEEGPLSHEQRRRLLDVYAGGDAVLGRALADRLAAHKRSLSRHRLLWARRRKTSSSDQ